MHSLNYLYQPSLLQLIVLYLQCSSIFQNSDVLTIGPSGLRYNLFMLGESNNYVGSSGHPDAVIYCGGGTAGVSANDVVDFVSGDVNICAKRSVLLL